jgi:hypothetical protein
MHYGQLLAAANTVSYVYGTFQDFMDKVSYSEVFLVS